MSSTFTLPDGAAAADLATLLGRAQRVDDGSVRLIAGGGVLAVYVAVFFPVGLLDESPTILGLRTFRVAETDELDVTVPIASLLARLESARGALGATPGVAGAAPTDAAAPVSFGLPAPVNTVTWAAISPPRGGWSSVGSIEPAVLDRVARAGIEQITTAVPEAVGESLVQRARSEVWSRPLREAEGVPAGAAFAARALGFVREGDRDAVPMFETGTWTRLSTPRGHVLVKRRSWSMAR